MRVDSKSYIIDWTVRGCCEWHKMSRKSQVENGNFFHIVHCSYWLRRCLWHCCLSWILRCCCFGLFIFFLTVATVCHFQCWIFCTEQQQQQEKEDGLRTSWDETRRRIPTAIPFHSALVTMRSKRHQNKAHTQQKKMVKSKNMKKIK